MMHPRRGAVVSFCLLVALPAATGFYGAPLRRAYCRRSSLAPSMVAETSSVEDGDLVGALGRQFKAALLAATVLAAPIAISPSQVLPPPGSPMNALPSISLRRSDALALNEEQQLAVDVWREVNRQYVDGTFNGMGEDGWKRKKIDTVKSLTDKAGDQKEAYKAIREMLSSLNDPYTRFLTPDQYESLASVARGGSAGIGVQLQADPATGAVVVLSTVRGGPAAGGGVLAGDEVLEVDGESMASATAELVAAKMRGAPGTTVDLAVRHAASGGGGGGGSGKSSSRLSLTRAAVKVSPVETGTFSIGGGAEDAAAGQVTGGKRVGLLRISSFSQETAAQMVEAIRSVAPGADALVVDLRGNAGGYMPAGVEGARLFLQPNSKIISEVRRDGTAETFFSEGIGSETKVPLYLLVDSRTASASEIMAAALQDNGRAKLVGPPGKTFGKGRIQNVQQLEDGSGVAVTKAKYVTPSGRDIHGIGLTPDIVSKTCGTTESAEVCLSSVSLL